MDGTTSPRSPEAAQQLITRYVTLVQEHTAADAFPASTVTLPAPKTAIKEAVRDVLEALSISHQLTAELTAFLEDAYVALANYVDDELAALAAEHRHASTALEADPAHLHPGGRLASPHWAVVARTSRLAGEIARASAEEASKLRREFQALLDGLARS